jgi:ferredoxin
MKVSIDQVSCVGSGPCVVTAPEVFDQQDEDGIAMLLRNAPDESLAPGVEEAARLCPAQAIPVSPT